MPFAAQPANRVASTGTSNLAISIFIGRLPGQAPIIAAKAPSRGAVSCDNRTWLCAGEKNAAISMAFCISERSFVPVPTR